MMLLSEICSRGFNVMKQKRGIHQTSGCNPSQICFWALLWSVRNTADFTHESDIDLKYISRHCVPRGLLKERLSARAGGGVLSVMTEMEEYHHSTATEPSLPCN